MGNKKSKPQPITIPTSLPNTKNNSDNPPVYIPKEKEKEYTEEPVSNTKVKKYLFDPVFGRMVFNELIGAWVPAEKEDMYEQSQISYLNQKEKNKKYLKTFDIKPELIKRFYKEDTHNSLTLIKEIAIKEDIYSYMYFLNDGRLAVNWDKQLKIYSKDFRKIEQKINTKSIYITQFKDNSLLNSRYNGVDIYKYNEKNKKFILDYALECINNANKVIELPNDGLAFQADNIAIFTKENGKYVKHGKELCITTIDDFILINENEIASISGQESEITFWDLTTREINAQIGDIKNFGRFCMLLYDKSLIIGGANRDFSTSSLIYIINICNKELINKYCFSNNIWFMIKLNEKEFITGESGGIISKYRYEENELRLMEKNKDHKDEIVQKLAFCSNSNQLASLSESHLFIFKINN